MVEVELQKGSWDFEADDPGPSFEAPMVRRADWSIAVRPVHVSIRSMTGIKQNKPSGIEGKFQDRLDLRRLCASKVYELLKIVFFVRLYC